MRRRTETTVLVLAIMLFILGFGILVSLCNNAAGAPQIINATNNQTGTHLYAHPDYGDSITFTVTASEPITTWIWHANEHEQFNNHPTHSLTYTGFGYHNVSVYGTNAGGRTNTVTWVVWVSRELRDTHAEAVDETAYNMIHDSVSEPSFHGFMQAVSYPYTSALGLLFYLFLFGLPILMMYLRQDSMTIPATLMFIIGGVIIAMLPTQWQIIAGALMGLALFGMLYKLYKERG